MKPEPYSLTKPCSNCPFRTDVVPYIRSDRVREIQRSLSRVDFFCHKTIRHGEELDEDEEEGTFRPTPQNQQCAGALILLEKEEKPSQMMRIGERLGLYDRTKLDMTSPVYDSFDQMYAAHRATELPRKRNARVKRGNR